MKTASMWVQFVLALTAATPFVLAPALARADAETCVDAANRGQTLRTSRKLVLAREALIVCAADSCPTSLRKACIAWLSETEASLPSIIPALQDARGHDIPGVRVWIDGAPAKDWIDGQSISVDPGTHEVRAESSDAQVSAQERIVAREGEKVRIIHLGPVLPPSVASVQPPSGPSPMPPLGSPPPLARDASAAPPSTRSLVSFVLGGASVVALGSFAYFGLTGRSRATELRTSCAPMCSESDRDAVHAKYVAADVSLVVSVVFAGAAAISLLLKPSPRHVLSAQRLEVASGQP